MSEDRQDVTPEADSVLLNWRDHIDHELAMLRMLQAEFEGMAKNGESLAPEGAEGCAELLKDVGDELTRVRMSIQGLASDAGEAGPGAAH